MAKFCTCSRPDIQSFGEDKICLSCGNSESIVKPTVYSINCHVLPSRPNTIESPHFLYKLLASKTAIRLIRLHKGRQEDPIQCAVFHTELEAHPDFEALSYTWGDNTLSQLISSTEGVLHVTMNCKKALRDFRYELCDRVLWIDAICINQFSNEEKNHQVPLMTRIYAAARQVIVYVASHEGRSDITNLFDDLRCGMDTHGTDSLQRQASLSWFLSRPWFRRVWVLQEVAVAQKAVVMWGRAFADWDNIRSSTGLTKLRLTLEDLDGRIPPILTFAADTRTPLRDFSSLIHTARSCHSTDPRDKVFALLGLLDKGISHHLLPDYNSTAEEVYIELAMNTIQSDNSLNVLLLAGRETTEEIIEAKELAKRAEAWFSGALGEWSYLDSICKMLNAKRSAKRARYNCEKLERYWYRMSVAVDTLKELRSIRVSETARDCLPRTEPARCVNLDYAEYFEYVSFQGHPLYDVFDYGTHHSEVPYPSPEGPFFHYHNNDSKTCRVPSSLDGDLLRLQEFEQSAKHELEILRNLVHDVEMMQECKSEGGQLSVIMRAYRKSVKFWKELKMEIDTTKQNMKEIETLRKHLRELRKTWNGAQSTWMPYLEWKQYKAKYEAEVAVHEKLEKIRICEEMAWEDFCAWKSLWEGTGIPLYDTSATTGMRDEMGFAGKGLADPNDRLFRRFVIARNLQPRLRQVHEKCSRVSSITKEWERQSDYKRIHSALNHYETILNEMPGGIHQVVSERLQSHVVLPDEHLRDDNNPATPSWILSLEAGQTLTSLACLPNQPWSGPRPPARLCKHWGHWHITPALTIKMLDLDIVCGTSWMAKSDPLRIDESDPRSNLLSNFWVSPNSVEHGSTFSSIVKFWYGRRRMVTDRSWTICSRQVRTGDKICAIYGASVPVVLRPLRDGGSPFKLLGECYLDGFRRPKDYCNLEWLGEFKQYFKGDTVEELPWKTVCLE